MWENLSSDITTLCNLFWYTVYFLIFYSKKKPNKQTAQNKNKNKTENYVKNIKQTLR